MQLKTIDSKGRVSLAEYTDRECSSIFTERDSYVLRLDRYRGADYGGSQSSEERETVYEEIIPERILVKDCRFCGALLLTDYDHYNGGGCHCYEETPLLIDGIGRRSVRAGYSFSNDDHDRWDYTDYSIVPRPDDV